MLTHSAPKPSLSVFYMINVPLEAKAIIPKVAL